MKQRLLTFFLLLPPTIPTYLDGSYRKGWVTFWRHPCRRVFLMLYGGPYFECETALRMQPQVAIAIAYLICLNAGVPNHR